MITSALTFLLLQCHCCVFQLLSQVWLSGAPRTAAHQASLPFTISQSWLKFMSIESVMLSNHLILCYPFLLPSIFPSIRVFSSESALCISWPKYWSFSISSSNEYSGLISFRIEWFDPLALQTMLKSLFPATRFKGINSTQWYWTKWTHFLEKRSSVSFKNIRFISTFPYSLIIFDDSSFS